jgi:hypothetical protein
VAKRVGGGGGGGGGVWRKSEGDQKILHGKIGGQH